MKKARKNWINGGSRLLVVGLGNPGPEYYHTRHNAGFLVVEKLAERTGASFIKQRWGQFAWAKAGAAGRVIYLATPLTYMNRSGDALGPIFHKTECGPEELLVVCDSLDLPVGTLRLKQKGGSAGQKGLESIIQVLGTDQFSRIFIGIGRPEYKTDIQRYVLSIPEGEEKKIFLESIDKAAEAVMEWAKGDYSAVMNEFNRKQ